MIAEIERSLGLERGALGGHMGGCFVFLGHRVRGWYRFLNHGRAEEIDGWVEEHLERLRELETELREVVRAQAALREGLARRGESDEAIAFLERPLAPTVWSMDEVEPALERFSPRA